MYFRFAQGTALITWTSQHIVVEIAHKQTGEPGSGAILPAIYMFMLNLTCPSAYIAFMRITLDKHGHFLNANANN